MLYNLLGYCKCSVLLRCSILSVAFTAFFSACCPVPTENNSSTNTQWAHAWWYQEHCCLSRGEPLPKSGALSHFDGPASGFTRDWCRGIHRQGQDPLTACWGGCCSSPSHKPPAWSGKQIINNRCLIPVWVTQLFSWPTFQQTCRVSTAPPLPSPHQ